MITSGSSRPGRSSTVTFIGLLYELEEQLAPRDFVRVSKSAIVNFDQVKSLRPDLGGRLRLTLSNGEVVVANRLRKAQKTGRGIPRPVRITADPSASGRFPPPQ